MTPLQDVAELGGREKFLAVVATMRSDSTIQASVVNAGVLEHPFGGEQVLGFVTYGRTKLRNLRVRPQITVTFRSGWIWAAVEGLAELIGPDDPKAGVDAERLRLRCSSPQGAPTTTGTPTTGRWPNSAAPSSSWRLPASTATDQANARDSSAR